MAVLVSCPVCGKGTSVAETQVGQTARCRQCGNLIRLSLAGTSPKAAALDHGGSARATARARTTAAPAAAHSIKEVGPSVAPDSPRQVGRFRVLGRLGAGAFGIVYRAHDPQLDRDVALKVPQAGTLESPKAVERFLREARAAARLQHPHIVAVHDAGQDGPLYYIATEFIPGQTLARAVEAAPLEFRVAAEVVRKVAEALAYAHRLGIVHRDVKPANVMLDAAGEPHLMDFGLAYRHGTEEKLTQDGALLGTPAYMAPEHAAGQKGQAQPASDQYALGVVLYELICGRLPFEGPVSIVLFNVMNQEPPAPRRLRPGVPKDLETICLKAMSKRPERRYTGCGEFADDLRRWLDGQSIRARRVGPVERLARWCRRQPLAASAAGVAVVCLLAVGVVLLVSGSKLAASALAAYSAEQKARQAREAEEQARAEAARKQEESNAKDDALKKAKEDAERREEERRGATEDAKKKENERKRADDEKRKKDDKRKKEEEDKLQAEEQKAAQFYVRTIQEVADKLEKGPVALASQVLDQCKPELRRWEWHYLKRRCNESPVFLNGHADIITGLAFNADGTRLASTSWDKMVRLWDVTTGKSLWELRDEVNHAVALSPDGTRLALDGVDVWDVAKRERIWHQGKPLHASMALTYSRDGKMLASGGEDKTVKVWEAETGKLIRNFEGLPDCVPAVAFSPDSQLVASCSGSTLTVWDVGTGKSKYAVITPPVPMTFDNKKVNLADQLTGVAFSPDGKEIVTCSIWGSVRVWDAATGREVRAIVDPKNTPRSGKFLCVSFSPDGTRILAGTWLHGVILYDAITGQRLLSWGDNYGVPVLGLYQGVTRAVFSPDGSRVATTVGSPLVAYTKNPMKIVVRNGTPVKEHLRKAP